MRLIDADALKNALIECTPYAIDPVYRNTNSNIDMFTAMEILDELPTIDAVSVVRGEWIEAKSGAMSVWPAGQVMCSVCKQRMPLAWKKMPPYCYGCGAKMEDKP